MARYQHSTRQRAVRRLRPSPESLAGAAAVYDPELMLQLNATRGRRGVSYGTAAAGSGD